MWLGTEKGGTIIEPVSQVRKQARDRKGLAQGHSAGTPRQTLGSKPLGAPGLNHCDTYSASRSARPLTGGNEQKQKPSSLSEPQALHLQNGLIIKIKIKKNNN